MKTAESHNAGLTGKVDVPQYILKLKWTKEKPMRSGYWYFRRINGKAFTVVCVRKAIHYLSDYEVQFIGAEGTVKLKNIGESEWSDRPIEEPE